MGISSVAGALPPADSALGIGAAALSPAGSYTVGQYFKGLAQENLHGGKTETAELTAAQGTARAVAHGVIAAATAAAGDNNALTAAISAGGAEAAAPYVSQWLYGEKDGSKLTAEQKETVSNILSLGGAAVGTASGKRTGAVAGSQSAQNAVENNATVEELRIEAAREAELRSRNPEWDKAYRLAERKQLEAVNFLADFIPVIGDIKGFAEAETKGDYLFAAMGIIPLYGDAAKKVHQAEKAYEAAKAAKDVGKMKAAMNEARKGADLPYDSQKVRVDLERRYGAENVRSTTVPPSNARNVKLAGRKHPVTGIVFDKKGFPIFDDIAKYDTKLNVAKFGSASYQEQMRMATRELREKIQSGKISTSQFTPSQLQAIKNGDAKIPELTWHHHQDKGRMQLIPEDKHKQTGHIGGDSMQKGK